MSADLTAYGLPLPAPDMSDGELVAWAKGFLAGWQHGRAEGYEQAYARADAELADALKRALAGSQSFTGTRYEAVRQHEHIVDAKKRRQAADEGRLAA